MYLDAFFDMSFFLFWKMNFTILKLSPCYGWNDRSHPLIDSNTADHLQEEFPRCFAHRFHSCKSLINYLSFSIPAKPIRPGQQPTSPSVRPGSSSGIGSALLGMTRLAGGAVMGSNVPNSPSTPSIPSSPNGATIMTPVIRGGKGSEPVVTYSKRIRNAVSTESLNRPLPQGSPRWVLVTW